MRRLRRLAGVVTGRMDVALVDALRGQLRATRDGAALAAAMIDARVSRTTAHDRIREIEHLGDDHRSRLIGMLSSSLITPIDREDLFRLSRSIDDVLDTLRDFIRESYLYRLDDQSRFDPILTQLTAAISDLEQTVADLVERPADAAHSALRARKASGAIRRACQYETARILSHGTTAEALKLRELTRRLELAAAHIGGAADAIADGAMKRWH